ncbi:acyltransferase 3 (plasmid) [Rhizobium grahamii CCGE 502]|uniref:Acyltransferase 3 n=1 Tax=Rhizobium grahamii CCGE 502 TaxID=990285 RepID=S3H4A8_9HYPH|nr:acyltransferase 3 [Rhizobium grahamii CCGE 502]
MLVVLYHARIGPFHAGYVGVDIFFVISGFLITNLVADQLEQSRFSFPQFYYQRAKRLLPAAYVVVALTTIAAPFLLSGSSLIEFRDEVLGALTFSGNIVLWFQGGYFDVSAETKPLLHFWSLAVEEQGYLLLSAFLAFSPRRWWFPGAILLFIASLALCCYLAFWHPAAAFYLLPSRFWEMALGSLAALLPVTPRMAPAMSWTRLLALAVLVFSALGLSHPVVGAASVCMATAVLLVIPGSTNGAVRAAAGVGRISYSLYLIHWPLLVYVKALWLAEPPALAIWSALAVSIVTSWLLCRFVEEPVRQGTPSGLRLVSGLTAASVILAVSPSVAIAVTDNDIDFGEMRRINFGLSSACDFFSRQPPHDIPEPCQSSKKPEMLVWGDSFAMALVPGLSETIGKAGLAQLTMSGCLPAIGVAAITRISPSPYSRAFGESCIRFNDSVLSILEKRKNISTVAISSPFDAPVSPDFKMLTRTKDGFVDSEPSMDIAVDGIKALIDAVRSLGKRVVVVAPPPVGNFDIGDCLERKTRGSPILGPYSNCKISLGEYRQSRARTLELLNQVSLKAAVEIVSFDDFLCDGMTCRTEIDGKFLYRDSGHLSYAGSVSIAQQTKLVERLIGAAR